MSKLKNEKKNVARRHVVDTQLLKILKKFEFFLKNVFEWTIDELYINFVIAKNRFYANVDICDNIIAFFVDCVEIDDVFHNIIQNVRYNIYFDDWYD